MSDADRAIAIAAPLLGEHAGLRIDGSTRGRLGRVLGERAASTGTPLDQYARALADDVVELEQVVERMTVQESAFFRHPEHFEAFARHLLPHHEPGVIWSAGCAHGEEAWSLAMLLVERAAAGWRVLASDVSRAALDHAQSGIYTQRQLRGLDETRRERFLVAHGDGRMIVRDRLRERVTFVHHNLVAGPPPGEAAGYPGVMCRNVLIYLRPDDQARFLEGLRARMPLGGILVLGAAEALAPDDPFFEAERVEGAYLYRPRVAARAPAATPPRPEARPARSRRPVRPAPVELPAVGDLLAEGERLAAAGEHGQAATMFRRAVYLAPSDVLAHVRLGLALERAGDGAAAVRAFRSARFVLERSERDEVEAGLGGWSVEELERLLREKLGTTA